MPEQSPSWRHRAESGVRRLAAITVAGAVLGVLVGGIGGRLAMGLLAGVNPAAHGLRSDDGFTIGQLTLSGSAQLLGASVQIGLIGAAVYAAVRFLMIGPGWFRVLSMAVGPAVVVGAALVDREGVDFTELDPPWLPVLLFVLLPGVYAGLLTLLAESWLGPDRWFARAPLPLVAATLLLWIPALPLLPVIVVVWAVVVALGRWSVTDRAIRHPLVPWLGRAALAAVFVLALADLVGDVRFLV